MATSGDVTGFNKVSKTGDTMTGALDLQIAGDANDRLQLLPSGTIQWGDGTLAPDVGLARIAVGVIQVSGKLQQASAPTVGDDLTNKTYVDGLVGGAVVDSIADGDTTHAPSRNAVFDALALKVSKTGDPTTGEIAFTAASLALGFSTRITADANVRWSVTSDGIHSWGGGSGATDASLFRAGTNVLQTGSMHFQRTITTTPTLRTNIVGDTTNRWQVLAGGRMEWGPGGVAAVDTILNRTNTAELSLTGSFIISAALRVNGNVGFYNTAPVAKPTVTGSRGANAALASLLTALAGQGLLTDSSTA